MVGSPNFPADQAKPGPRVCRRARAWRGCALTVVSLLVLAMAGCTTLGSSITDSMKLALTGHHSTMPDAAQVATNPYAQMFVRTANGQGVLVLGNIDGARQAWYGKGHVVVFLRHGRVVATTGLDHGLAGLHAPADNPFAHGLQQLSAPVTYTETLDWPPYRYGVPVTVHVAPQGMERVSILGQAHDLLRVDATLDAPAAGWRAVNRFWVDPADGRVWKSRQHVSPGQVLTLVLLKPWPGAAP